jgi:excinuclease ABC subunit B
MYSGDRSRKQTLIDFGFRLPTALDNRPLKFEEFSRHINKVIYVSATPNQYELSLSKNVAEQLVRPTGLTDPEVIVKKTKGQIDDLIAEIQKRIAKKQRVLVTTLTKRMAEDLAAFLEDRKIKVQYLHSEIETLDRIDILDDLRKGLFDVIVGINLLREGLDLPEVSLVAILDADKEGFLRSETSLIQTMGRAARHKEGQVIMYADNITGSMQRAIDEVTRRRLVQLEYNKKHKITPKTIEKPIREKLVERHEKEDTKKYVFKDAVIAEAIKRVEDGTLLADDKQKLIKILQRQMKEAAKDLDFEQAAVIRDHISNLKVNSKT